MVKPKFNIGDLVRPLPGHYEGYTPGSQYNLRRGPAIVVESQHGYIKVVTIGGGVSPALNPESFELHSEIAEGPVRTVTRKEIVPGVYGRVAVEDMPYSDKASVRLADKTGKPGPAPVNYLTPAELRAAAATFIELADALDEVA